MAGIGRRGKRRHLIADMQDMNIRSYCQGAAEPLDGSKRRTGRRLMVDRHQQALEN